MRLVVSLWPMHCLEMGCTEYRALAQPLGRPHCRCRPADLRRAMMGLLPRNFSEGVGLPLVPLRNALPNLKNVSRLSSTCCRTLCGSPFPYLVTNYSPLTSSPSVRQRLNKNRFLIPLRRRHLEP